LAKLSLTSNTIERTKLGSVDHLNTLRFDKLQPGVDYSLKVLDLSRNELGFIPKKSKFLPPLSLLQLVFSNNKIGEFHSGAVEELVNFVSLDLAGNPFEKLDMYNITYRETPSLQFLDICSNANRSIIWHDLSRHEEVHEVNMKQEQIEQISNVSGFKFLCNHVFAKIHYP
jgi:hypothetical protein